MADYTQRNYSSSSDDAQENLGQENHYDDECRYHRFAVRLKRRHGRKRLVYVWLRSCFCGEWDSFNVMRGAQDLQEEDGKDVHFSKECKWRKRWVGDTLTLSNKCVCSQSGNSYNSYTGNSYYTY